MTRDVEEIEADAWRSIRVAGRPLVRPETTSPLEVIREAHVRLRELRTTRQFRCAQNDNHYGDDDHAE